MKDIKFSNCPKGFDPKKKELYLTDAEFAYVFNETVDSWLNRPLTKRK